MKRFVIRPLVLIGLILLTIVLWATAYSYKLHYGLAYRFGLIDIGPAPALDIGKEKFIAPAAGEIQGFSLYQFPGSGLRSYPLRLSFY